MSLKPFATVVINTVNEVPQRLKEAIQSYKNQTGVNMQILVSTVEGDIAASIAKEMKVDCIINPQAGIYEQLNNALHYVKGDWWSYASGNDTAHKNKTIDEINGCINNKALVCYSNFVKNMPDTKECQFMMFADYNYVQHLVGNFVNDCAIMSTKLIEKYAPFRFELWHNDSFWDFWLRVAEGEGHDAFFHNKDYTWDYNVYSDSKHILRQKNPAELQVYAQVRQAMLQSHIDKKYEPKNNIPFHIRCELPIV